MKSGPRSECPISGALELVGDRWTLVILRDVLLAKRSAFSELAAPEGIATNVLSERLKRLETAGIVERVRDPEDGRRWIYRPTPKGRALIPTVLELGLWGIEHGCGTAHADLFRAYGADREGALARLMAGED